jgi:hypothetical protein
MKATVLRKKGAVVGWPFDIRPPPFFITESFNASPIRFEK